MRTIYKYPMAIDDETSVLLPRGATILRVDHQGNNPRQLYVWAIVDTDDKQCDVARFFVRGTGHPLTGEEGDYVNTVHAMGLVWHVFTHADDMQLNQP